jgi:hypothetical protein
MKFNLLYNSLLEGFNIPPLYQNAVQSGPDAGITSGDINNTFPSKISNVNIKLPKFKNKKTKQLPKEKSAKYRQGTHERGNQV